MGNRALSALTAVWQEGYEQGEQAFKTRHPSDSRFTTGRYGAGGPGPPFLLFMKKATTI